MTYIDLLSPMSVHANTKKRCFVSIMYSNKATITNSNNVSYFSTDTESREENNLANNNNSSFTNGI